MKDKEVREYALGTGILFVAEGRVAEDVLESASYKAGETKGTCTLRYECNTKELFDIDGNVVTVLRYGEKARIRGSVGRIFGTSLESVLSVKRGGVSVLLVCPLPNGEEFRLYLCGAVRTAAVFDVSDGGGLDFELVCGGDVPHPKFCMAKEEVYL